MVICCKGFSAVILGFVLLELITSSVEMVFPIPVFMSTEWGPQGKVAELSGFQQ